MASWSESSVFKGIAASVSALLLASGLTVVSEVVAPEPAQAAVTAPAEPAACVGAVSLVNGGFEQPTVPAGGYAMLAESAVPGWLTNDSKNQIEIWSNGFQGVPAAAGKQFAELNANSASRLYQDVATTPGQTLTWSLKHRGRSGVDTMRVLIGPPSGTLQDVSGPLSDGTSAWGTHPGTYTVPAGQTTTRFAFEAVGGSSVGNFLDDITFGTEACLITNKSVTNLSRSGETAEVGDTLRYTVNVRNGGGSTAREVIGTDAIQAGLDYVPGSLRVLTGAGAGALTDAAGDDRGEFVAGEKKVAVRLGTGATASAKGTLAPGDSTSYSFDAKVTTERAGSTVVNRASTEFFNSVANATRTSLSEEIETPVAQAADLSVVKTLNTSPLVAGEPISYTIRAKNAGPGTATGVRVADPIPTGVGSVTAESSAGSCEVAGGQVTCELPDLAVGAETEITVEGVLSPALAPGAGISNTAVVSGTLTDPVPSNNTSTATGTITTSADLSIEKTFAPDAPVAGEPLTYTLEVTNHGPSEARDVSVVDPLDPETEFVSASVDGGTCTGTTEVRCALGTLAPGATKRIEITVMLAAGAGTDEGVVQNTAAVSSSTSDPDPTNNVSSTSFRPEIEADLAIEKSASRQTVSAGDTVDFDLVVTNNGPSDAVNVSVSDVLPAGFVVESIATGAGTTCSSPGDSEVRCTITALASGATAATITVTARVASDAPEGTVTNTAAVAAPAEDRDITNNASSADVEVVQSADVRIQKLGAGDPVPGGQYVYTLNIENAGPSVARDVIVVDRLPDGFTYVTDDGECAVTDGVLRCTLGDLPPGGPQQVSIHVSGVWDAGVSGTAANTASVSTATTDPDLSNNESTTEKDFAPSADVSVAKKIVDPDPRGDYYLGQEIKYEVVVRNDGPSVAHGVLVTEQPEPGLTITSAEPSAGNWSNEGMQWAVGSLEPGASATLIVTAVLGAIPEDGKLTNAVEATADTPDPEPENNTTGVDVPVSPAADMAIEKVVDLWRAAPGATLTYTLTVTNHGPSTAEIVNVHDLLPSELTDVATTTPGCSVHNGSNVDCTFTQFEVGAERTVTITAKVPAATTEDAFLNRADVLSPVTRDLNPRNDTSDAVTVVTRSPGISLEKTAGTPKDLDGDGRIGAGDAVPFTFTATNTGDVPLSGAVLTDELLGGAPDCAIQGAGIPVGGSVECTVEYTLTQADVDRGTVHNEASVTAKDPVGTEVDDAAETDAVVPTANGISLTKTAGDVEDVDGDGRLGAGDRVTYTFSVRNTGTTTLSNAVITDEMLGGTVACSAMPEQLAPGAEATCAAVEYTLTQADIDAGTVHNEASVIADAPRGTVTDTASADVDAEGVDALELVKHASEVVDTTEDGRIGAGDTIEYTFEAFNRGTTTLRDVQILDPKLGDDALCTIDEIAPGASAECKTFAYTLTQDDVEAGLVHNTASATGTGSTGTVTDESGVDVIITGFNALELRKTAGDPVDANGDGVIGAGDTVAFGFEIENTGTTVLRELEIDDPLLGGALDCPALAGAALQPGDTLECGPVTYELTQRDIDRGAVHNAATATGSSTSGPATDRDTADVEIIGSDALALEKTAGAPVDANGDGMIGAGDTVDYSFTVRNTGTTTLRNARISDELLGGGLDCPALADAVLAPGDAAECGPVPYTLTQEDIERGTVHNEATATADAPQDRTATGTDDADAAITGASGISLEKVAGDPVDANQDGRIGAGDTVSYRFTVTNTGTVRIGAIEIVDEMLGGALDCPALDGATLAPGASLDCGPIEHVLEQGEVDGGVVHNTAAVTGDTALGEVTDTAQADVTVDGASSIGLEKRVSATVDVNDDGMIGAGDAVEYAFVVRNLGTTTLANASIVDEKLGGALDCPALDGATLAPGDALECGPVRYTLTQADVDRGSLVNTATVTADAPSGEVSDEASIETGISGTDGIALVKRAAEPVDANRSGRVDAGDTVEFSFEVANTGTTTLTDIAIDDPRLDGPVVCDPTTLAPGERVTCTGPVAELTQAEIDARAIVNTATVAGEGTARVTAEDSVTVALDAAPGVRLEKSGGDYADTNRSGEVDAGDTVAFRFTVENTGATTLTGVVIDDALLGGRLDCGIADLAPGERAECGPIRYVLTQQDVKRGYVDNEAFATGTDGTDTTTGSDEVRVKIPTLAVTGAAGTVLPWAAGLLLAGAAVLLVRRKRREA